MGRYVNVKDKLPENYRQVKFAIVTKEGDYKWFDGLYHDGFYWCGIEKKDVIVWRYKTMTVQDVIDKFPNYEFEARDVLGIWPLSVKGNEQCEINCYSVEGNKVIIYLG